MTPEEAAALERDLRALRRRELEVERREPLARQGSFLERTAAEIYCHEDRDYRGPDIRYVASIIAVDADADGFDVILICSSRKEPDVQARDMQPGRQYRLQSTKDDGRRRVVEFDRFSADGEFAIVRERGDPAESFGIRLHRSVEPVPDVADRGHFCPACGEPVVATSTPENPATVQWDVMCDCGWMGNRSEEDKP